MPLISTAGGGSIRGVRGSSSVGSVVYTSRASAITEGEVSNFGSVSVGATTWSYAGNNTDAITITTSGSTADLVGFSICNRASGTAAHSGVLYLISGNTTGGTVLAQKSFSVLLPLNQFQTIIEFDTPVTLSPGTYTCAMAWPYTVGSSTYRHSTTSRSNSSVKVGSRTLNVSYATTSLFNGGGALNTTNGTSQQTSGAGQVVAFKWIL